MNQIITQYSQEAQNTINQQTNLRINQHTLGVCLQTVASYFDTITLNLEDFAKDTKLNAQDITIDEKTNIATIHGTINGKNITIFYNLNTGELQANNYLSKAINGNTFFINDISGHKGQFQYNNKNLFSLISSGGI